MIIAPILMTIGLALCRLVRTLMPRRIALVRPSNDVQLLLRSVRTAVRSWMGSSQRFGCYLRQAPRDFEFLDIIIALLFFFFPSAFLGRPLSAIDFVHSCGYVEACLQKQRLCCRPYPRSLSGPPLHGITSVKVVGFLDV